jgi:hypothetical protein
MASKDKLTLFLQKVQKTDTCWIWIAAKDKAGYGKFRLTENNTTAHRAAYILFKGLLAKGLVIDHLCRNKSCVNPEHLEAVPQLTNLERGINVPSMIHKVKTHCPKGHEYSGDNLKLHKSGRHCKICQRNNLKNWRKVRGG